MEAQFPSGSLISLFLHTILDWYLLGASYYLNTIPWRFVVKF